MQSLRDWSLCWFRGCLGVRKAVLVLVLVVIHSPGLKALENGLRLIETLLFEIEWGFFFEDDPERGRMFIAKEGVENEGDPEWVQYSRAGKGDEGMDVSGICCTKGAEVFFPDV